MVIVCVRVCAGSVGVHGEGGRGECERHTKPVESPDDPLCIVVVVAGRKKLSEYQSWRPHVVIGRKVYRNRSAVVGDRDAFLLECHPNAGHPVALCRVVAGRVVGRIHKKLINCLRECRYVRDRLFHNGNGIGSVSNYEDGFR